MVKVGSLSRLVFICCKNPRQPAISLFHNCPRFANLPNVFLGELETPFYLGLGGTGTKQLEKWLLLSRLFYHLPWESSFLKKQKLKVNTEVFWKGPPTETQAGEPEVAL